MKTGKHLAMAFSVMASMAFTALVGVETAQAETQCGKAAWYDARGRTASGEFGTRGQMAAAHRTLPFGTRVKVENLGNGRSVIVRINDRGPGDSNRVIDVSRAAASQLGFIKAGITDVRVTALGGDGRLLDGACSEPAAAAALVAKPRERPQASWDQAPPEQPSPDQAPRDTMAARFALGFQEDDWAQAEMAKALEALTSHAWLSRSVCPGNPSPTANCPAK